MLSALTLGHIVRYIKRSLFFYYVLPINLGLIILDVTKISSNNCLITVESTIRLTNFFVDQSFCILETAEESARFLYNHALIMHAVLCFSKQHCGETIELLLRLIRFQ